MSLIEICLKLSIFVDPIFHLMILSPGIKVRYIKMGDFPQILVTHKSVKKKMCLGFLLKNHKNKTVKNNSHQKSCT